ncbi:M48 family metalloprotease [Flavobacterium sp. GA093]|uniref:M48 family metalloprotease n=1 Tax=Flavobacterium hydrocarbonoxydans TaxID=2683249 RepID=A0A6I4NQA3_9FLAO|nr:M48 family metallopeptidase [Flavobacterium hydrocarbonoxydans]MWB96373.1 M48 family metalloprotease [Flavobacterium hydrocarbonoxydans]
MKKYLFSVAFIAILVGACATNPFSGKSTLALVPDSEILPASFQQYDKFLSENKVVTGTADAKRVENVGVKIKGAAERWLNANGYKDYLKNYQWEYKLIDSKELNAWCMPGGKIVFYTGILPVCQDDAGIATVMGHEVAHALANHGQQRMSAAQLQQIGGSVLDAATSSKSESTRAIFAQAYGLGTEVGGMLPFSRANESEADKIGLILMALAGYNPDTAVAFWSRMSKASGGGAPSEFLSTHPSDATRIANLKALIPQAKAEAAKYGVTFK